MMEVTTRTWKPASTTLEYRKGERKGLEMRGLSSPSCCSQRRLAGCMSPLIREWGGGGRGEGGGVVTIAYRMVVALGRGQARTCLPRASERRT